MTIKYGIQSAAFSQAIHIGRLNTTHTEFTDKEDATDMALAAVAMYVKHHFDGGMEATFPGMNLRLNITVTPLKPEESNHG